MAGVGFAALVANAVSFGMLWVYREGDANMRSAWICTRNDVLGNFAVLLAALGVFGSEILGPAQLAFTRDALVRLGQMFDPVLKLAVFLGKPLCHDV